MLSIRDMSLDKNSIVNYLHRCVSAVHEHIRGDIIETDTEFLYVVTDKETGNHASVLRVNLTSEEGYIKIERRSVIPRGRWKGYEVECFYHTDVKSFVDWYEGKYSVVGDIVSIQ